MFPKSQPVVNWIIEQWPSSPKTGGWIMGCWMLAVIGSVLGEERSKVSWWDLSTVLGFPLSLSQSTNHIAHHYWTFTQPTHRQIQRPTPVLVLLYCFFVMILMTPLCLWIHVLCLDLALTQSHLITQSWCVCLQSAPLWFHCLHTLYCYLFLANWSMFCPALNFLVYN